MAGQNHVLLGSTLIVPSFAAGRQRERCVLCGLQPCGRDQSRPLLCGIRSGRWAQKIWAVHGEYFSRVCDTVQRKPIKNKKPEKCLFGAYALCYAMKGFQADSDTSECSAVLVETNRAHLRIFSVDSYFSGQTCIFLDLFFLDLTGFREKMQVWPRT